MSIILELRERAAYISIKETGSQKGDQTKPISHRRPTQHIYSKNIKNPTSLSKEARGVSEKTPTPKGHETGEQSKRRKNKKNPQLQKI